MTAEEACNNASNYINAYCKKNKIANYKFAEQIGLSRNTIWNITKPFQTRFSTLITISSHMGITLSELIGETAPTIQFTEESKKIIKFR